MTKLNRLQDLWLSVGLPADALHNLHLEGGAGTAVQSCFRLGEVAQAAVGLSGLSAAHIYSLRTGVEQDVTVDARHVVLSFCSERWYLVNGTSPEGRVWDEIAGLYQTKGGGFVRVHTNFPHHRRGILDILGIEDTPNIKKAQVARALATWNSVEFERNASQRGMCAAAFRTFADWQMHPHAQALLDTPPVTLIKIGHAAKRQFDSTTCTRPLEGIRVLDLSRVLAGPVGGRTLAAHGADVLLVTSPNLPSLPLIDVETSLGKRTCQLDLNSPADHETLLHLAKDCDVFLQAYRPGGLENKGFGAQDLAALRPGIVCANLTAWGFDGPWKDRRGFDSLVQTATGFNADEGHAYQTFVSAAISGSGIVQPRSLPLQALDHAAGYLLAFGINAALAKTIKEGGSWEVRVSLAAVGNWVRSFGCLPPLQAFGASQSLPQRRCPPDPEVARVSVEWPECAGRRGSVTTVRHPAILAVTPVKEGDSGGEAPMRLNAHEPKWL